MTRLRLTLLTALTMTAFAGNSLLCRLALTGTGIDAAGFTAIRLSSGALALWLLARSRNPEQCGRGNWPSAIALFAYAAGFSFAYLTLTAATGALLLFAAVQVTMVGYGLLTGERLNRTQGLGLLLAFGGLVALLLPGISAPSPTGAVLMLGAGVAWGLYSLRGRESGDPTGVTAGNFGRATLLGALLCAAASAGLRLDGVGIVYAAASGVVASGLGYALWYMVLPAMAATHAATVQLSVPVLTAIGGILFLGEPVTLRLALTAVAILGGIALVIRNGRSETSDRT